jgi:diguanylate cyclase (GGDEF)-like protein
VEQPPNAGENAGSEARRDSSNITIALLLGYVSSQGGDEAVAAVLDLAGEKRPLAELNDETRWSTQEQKIALLEAAAAVLDDPEVGRHVGETVLQQRAGFALRLVLRTVGSPRALCRSIAKASAKFSTNYVCEALSVSRNGAVVSSRILEGYEPSRLDCDYTWGLLSQIPALFGLPPAAVSHHQCQVDGAEACIYQLHWRARYRMPWRKRAARVDYLTDQLHTLTEHYEALQSTLVDLVSPADVDTVLARIAARAASAVRAQKFVLAVSSDDQLAVHHDGMTDQEALALAKDILVPDPDDRGGSRLIVDVASARQTYGRLAAVYGAEHSFFPEEHRLLATYARQAAVALDAATALEEARVRGETANTLLDLARSLARATTTGEVAQRLAEAVPAVVGSQRASVLLWDPARQELAVHGRGGDAMSRPGQTIIRISDTPELGALLTSLEPRHLRRDSVADPFIGQMLANADLEEVLVVPIVINGDLFGAVSASRESGAPALPERAQLEERMSGMADQAALAFEKVRLLEQERAAVSRLQRDEEHIKFLAYHDALTGLPNGRMFGELLEAALAGAASGGQAVAVLFFDLDRFKNVNDSLGHVQGDELLRLAAARLAGAVRAGDTLARLGGDEFTVLVTGIASTDEPARAADRMLRSLHDPFTLDGQEVYVSASVGVAVYPEDGSSVEALMKNADTAMYRAKAGGRNGQVRYAPSMNSRARHLLALESDLHCALEREQLTVYFQPAVDALTGRTTAAEALVRWCHPERGVVSPADFVPLAEESGLILAIDEWVLGQACAQARRWEREGLGPLTVSVNLSAHQFDRIALADVIRAALDQSGLSPTCLELELTESAAMRDPERVGELLRQLHELGVGLAVDDFGTGYSILGHLSRFPISRLKIDRSFVAGLPSGRHDRAIVASTIDMAHRMGVQVTAEGVERRQQADFLTNAGCDLLQGYLFAKPMPADVLTDLLRQQAQGAAAQPKTRAAKVV